MKIIYRESTQCDSCKTVTDSPKPEWSSQGGCISYDQPPSGWMKIQYIKSDGLPAHFICDKCKLLSFETVVNLIENIAND